MAKAEILPGICGFTTNVEASLNGRICKLQIESACKDIQKLAAGLPEVEPYGEITNRPEMAKTLELGIKFCSHAACPVPVGIIKTIEVEAKLALPAEVNITLIK